MGAVAMAYCSSWQLLEKQGCPWPRQTTALILFWPRLLPEIVGTEEVIKYHHSDEVCWPEHTKLSTQVSFFVLVLTNELLLMSINKPDEFLQEYSSAHFKIQSLTYFTTVCNWFAGLKLRETFEGAIFLHKWLLVVLEFRWTRSHNKFNQ